MSDDVWQNAVSDLWNNGADWDLGVTPGATDSAFLTVPGNYTVTLTTATSLASVTLNNASAALVDETSGAAFTLSGTLTNYGYLGVDNAGATGGTTWSIGGVFTNAGTMTVGCGNGYNALTATATVDVTGGLTNTGTLNLIGGVGPIAAVVSVDGAAGFGVTGTLTGSVNLSGAALLEFGSGSISEIEGGGELTLNGPLAFLANAGNVSSNSALTTLASVAGSLSLENGAAVTTTTDLANSGFIGVDNGGFSGGSSLTVDGRLSNAGTMTIGAGNGYAALSAPVTVTAVGGLANTGTINLEGGSAPEIATLNVGGVAGFGAAGVLTGNVNLSGDAVIAFDSGSIATIASGAELTLNGASTFLADAGALTSNGALTDLSSVLGSLSLENGAAVSVNGGLAVSGFLGVDNFGFAGGSSLAIAGQLGNSATITIGAGANYAALSAPVTVTASSFANTGTLNLQGGVTPNLATLNIAGPAGFGTLGSLTGNVNLSGDALLEFGGGSIQTIVAGAELTLQGGSAFVADAGATSANSALTGLDEVAGSLSLENGASVTTSGPLDNTGFIGVDNGGGAGGSSLTIGGLLSNEATITIGAGSGYNALSAPVTVSALSGLSNTGTINLQGGVSPNLATLFVAGPAGFGAAGVLAGSVNLSGDALLEFGSDQISTIALGAELTLNGANALVADAGALTTNSALTGLANVAGGLYLDNGAAVVSNVALVDSGSIFIDAPGATGGSSLTVNAALTVSGTLQVGNTAYGSLIAPATVTADSLLNTGTITLLGNASELAELKVIGAATNAGSLSIGATTELSVGGVFTQQSGTTTVAGDLSAASIDVTGGLLDFTAAVTAGGGVGPISIGAHGEVEFDAAVDSAVSVAFTATLGTLDLTAPTQFAGSISGFGGNDAIDLSGVSVASLSYAGNSSAGTLTVNETGGGSFTLAFKGDYTTSSFAAISDGAGGDDIIAAPIDAWTNASGGAWETGGNWSTGAAPSSSASVVIALPGTYTVSLSSDHTVGSLTITDGSATLAIATPGVTETVTGNLIDAGAVSISTTGSSGASSLIVGGDLESSGSVSLRTNGAAAGGGSQLSVAGGWQNSGTASIDAALGVGANDVSVGGSLANSGTIYLDTDTDYGLSPSANSTIAIAGQLHNTGTINVGNGIQTANSEISAATLDNTGAINLSGNNTIGAGQAAELVIAAAAPTIWTGSLSMAGQALLQFGGGEITSVAKGAQIYLGTSQGYIADAGATTSNSALTGLDAIAGDFELQYAAAVSVSGSLDVTGSLELDTQTNYGNVPSGGSVLTIADALVNSGTISIGGAFFNVGATTSTSTLSAATLQNTGSIYLFGNNTVSGNTKQAKIAISAAATKVWTGLLSMQGQSQLEFGSGSIEDVAAGAEIYLASADGYISDSATPNTNSALTGLTTIHGDFEEQYGASVSVANSLTVYGSLNIDTTSNYGDYPSGGSSISIGGALINDGTVSIGNGFFGNLQLTSTGTISAASLQNKGTINLSGNGTVGNGQQAQLIVSGAAPSQLTGTINLNGQALLEFGSGQISDIAAGATLNISTGDGYVADAGAITSNSALTGLTSNEGTLNLEFGAAAALSGALSNSGVIDLDTYSYFGSYSGGGRFSTVGLLTNSGTLNFGANGITAATIVNLGGLENATSGALNITGAATNAATVTVAGAAQATWTGTLTLNGDATLQYSSGQFSAIAAGASIYIGAANSGVVDAGSSTPNSVLSGLQSNAGTLNLEYGAAATLSAGLVNTGTIDINTTYGSGDTSFAIDGTLTNKATVNLGSAGESSSVTTSFGSVVNTSTGTFNVIGYLYTTAFDISGTLANAGTLNLSFGVHSEVGGFVNTGNANVSGEVGVPTSFEVIGSAENAYNLTIGAFGQMGVTGAFVNSGYLTVAGSLDLQSGIEITAGGYLTLNNGAVILPTDGLVTLDSGAVVSGDGSIGGPVANSGAITASGGSLAITGAITGAGSLAIAANSELELGGATAEGVNFGGNVGTLKLDAPANFSGAISGLALDDVIDLAGVQATSAVVSGSTLTVTAGAQTYSYQVSGAGLSGNLFAIESDGAGGSDLVLGPPGPTISVPKSLTAFNSLASVLGPITIADPTAGAQPLKVVISDTTGILGAVPAGAGSVDDDFTNQITLTGSLTDINTELASLVYGANVNGDDVVTVTVTDGGGKIASQKIAVKTVTVPYTPAVINFPTPAYVLPNASTGFNGVSISDPYAQTTGQSIPLTFVADGTLTLTENTSAVITGQGTTGLTVTGTVDQLNTDFADGLADSLGEFAIEAYGLSGAAIAEKALKALIAAASSKDSGGNAGDALNAAFKELTAPPTAESLVAALPGTEAAWFEFGVEAVSFALNSVVAALPGNEPADLGGFLFAAAKFVLHFAGKGGHVVLPDGNAYTLDAAGEFTLAKSTLAGDSLDVQVRLQPVAGSSAASEATEVAAAVGTDRVTFDATRSAVVWINGVASSIGVGQSVNLTGGILNQASANSYKIVYNTGEVVTVVNEGGYLDTSVAPGPNEEPGDVVGLASTGDNAFVLPDGTALTQPISAAQFQTFVNAWRLTPSTSLLDYSAGQSTATFTNDSYPEVTLSLSDFPTALTQQALNVVTAAGITDPGAQLAAEYDYILSGGSATVVAADANQFKGLKLTSVAPTQTGPAPAAIGVYAATPSEKAATSGATEVTFDVYLTATSVTATIIDYAVVAGDASDFTAAEFGGTLPSGSISIAAGSKTGQITIAVPQGALGASAAQNLELEISSPSGAAVVAATAQTEVYQPEPGPPAVAQLEYLGALGNLTRVGNNYTLDLGAIQPGERIPDLQFGIVNAANAPADQLTGAFDVTPVIGYSVSGDSIPNPIHAGSSYEGLSVAVNEAKFGGNSETIVFTPQDVNASGYSSSLSPITLTITDTLELPGLVYSQAWGDVHIVTYNGLKYDFQASGDFTLAKSNIAGDTFDIQLRLAPWYTGAPVTTIKAVALSVGADRVTFDWNRASTVEVDGTAETFSGGNSTQTIAGGTITEVSSTVYKVNWNTGETVTISEDWGLTGNTYITVVDGVLGSAGPGAYSGLQGENEGQQNDFQLSDGTVLAQPLTTAELYGEFANSWHVSSSASLFDTAGTAYTAPTSTTTLADLPASALAEAQALVAAAGITDPGIAQSAILDYLTTGDPSFISAAANIQQTAQITAPANVTASTPAPAELGVNAASAKVVEAASGATSVTFDVYLTEAVSTATVVDYTVAAPGLGFFGASAFGGTLPSGSITIAANATSGQFTIALPQGALGNLPEDNLQVAISSPGGVVPVFAPTAQTEIVNNAPVAGEAAAPELGYLGSVGTFTFDSTTNTYTLNLDGLIQDSQQFAADFAVTNAAAAPGDSLGGSFSTPSGSGFLVTGNALPAPLGAGASYFGLQATVDPTSLGSNGETIVFSPTDINDSGYAAALAPIKLKIVDTVVAAATPRVNTPTTIVFNNVHVGGVDQQHVSVANTAATGAASLDVKLTASGDAVTSGSIENLAPGATDATDLTVGIDTSKAGARSGSVQETFSSDTGATKASIFVDNPSIDVFGGVYRLATSSIQSNPLTVHVGDSGAQTVTITNTDPNDGYSENLIATVVGTTGAVTAQGTTGDIAAQASGTLNVNFATTTPGQIGTVTLDLKSDGGSLDGLGLTDLGDITIPVVVTSGNRPAVAQFEELSGGGTWTQNGAAYTLDLGSIDAPTTISLGVVNSAMGPADTLSGSFSVVGDSAFVNSGFTAFSGVAAGTADVAPSVTLGAGSQGTFTETITLSPVDASGGGDQALAPETLTITGTVTNIPPTLHAPTSATIAQGQASSIGTVSVADSDPYAPHETFTVDLVDLHGLLSATTTGAGGGGTITGVGTNVLEIVGSLAEVNADLLTLTDTSASDDTISMAVLDGRGGAAQAKTAVTVQAPTVTIAVVAGDDVIDNAEAHAAGGVALSGTVTGLSAGATFSVSVTDGSFSKSYLATVDSAATGWTATIPEADVITLADGAATVSAAITGAGGAALASASRQVTVAETLPTVTIAAVEGDNVINNVEAHAAGGVALSGTVSGLAAGATFSISVTDGAFSKSYTAKVNSAATGWTATIPEADAITLPNGTATLSTHVTDTYGNVSLTATDQVTVAQTLPTVTIAAVNGNNVINDATAHAAGGVALSGAVSGLAAGATFQVSVADGAFSQTYTATVGPAATGWTAVLPEADAITLPSGVATISAQVTDAYGNVSALATDRVTVAETPPALTIATVAGDNVINAAEAHAPGGVALSGTVSGLAAGATFQVSVADGAFSKNYTATVDSAGTGWTATIPEVDAITLPNGTATISAEVTDSHGNVSATATDRVTVAETPPTVTIAAVDGDNVINHAQAHAPGGVALSGTVSGLAAGATFQVSVVDGAFSKSYTATVNSAATGWTATIPEADASTLPSGPVTIKAQATDAYGNVSDVATDQATVTVAAPAPTVTIAPVDGDNVINEAEAHAAGGVALSGAVTGLAAGATFSVSVTDGGFSKSYTARVDAAGTGWTATISEADAITLADGTATIRAQVTDSDGVESTPAIDEVTIAESLPTVTIGVVAGDDVLNEAEASTAAGVALSGGSTGLAQGATFTVKVADGGAADVYTATVGANGAWSASIPKGDAAALANGLALVTAQATDAYGNVSSLASHDFTVAKSGPTLTIATVAGDDVLDAAEAKAAGGVAVTGGSTDLATGATFTLSLTDGGASYHYTATVGAGGAWTATIPTADAQALAEGIATLSAQATDVHGNASSVVTHRFTVAETAPTVTIDKVEGDDVLTSAEASAPGGVLLTGSSTGLAVGATFTVTVADGGVSHRYTATVGANGKWTATVPSADAELLVPGSAEVSAQATDAHGNVSPTATQAFNVASTGVAQGDVHLVTFDGLHIDFQATGEFVLAQSTDVAHPFEVQIQASAYYNLTSVTTEIAAQVGDDALVFKTDGSVTVNGVLDTDSTINLDGGSFSRLAWGGEEVQWANGEVLQFAANSAGYFDLTMTLSGSDGANSVQGLLGRNAGQASDFNLPDGTIVTQPLSEDELTGFYADAWRVTQADSLFTGAAPAPAAPPAASTAVLASGLSAERTTFHSGQYEVATSGIVGESYDGSEVFYDSQAHIQTSLFTKDGVALGVENWNADGSVRNSELLGPPGSPFGSSSTLDLEAFSPLSPLTFHEDPSHAYGLLTISNFGETVSLRLAGDYSASDFSVANDGQGGALLRYHAA